MTRSPGFQRTRAPAKGVLTLFGLCLVAKGLLLGQATTPAAPTGEEMSRVGVYAWDGDMRGPTAHNERHSSSPRFREARITAQTSRRQTLAVAHPSGSSPNEAPASKQLKTTGVVDSLEDRIAQRALRLVSKRYAVNVPVQVVYDIDAKFSAFSPAYRNILRDMNTFTLGSDSASPIYVNASAPVYAAAAAALKAGYPDCPAVYILGSLIVHETVRDQAGWHDEAKARELETAVLRWMESEYRVSFSRFRTIFKFYLEDYVRRVQEDTPAAVAFQNQLHPRSAIKSKSAH